MFSFPLKAQSSTSAKSINEDDTCISLFASEEYVPALKADETREDDLICTTSGEFGTEFIGEIIFGIHVGGVRVGTYR
jgi:hypothetical protein